VKQSARERYRDRGALVAEEAHRQRARVYDKLLRRE